MKTIIVCVNHRANPNQPSCGAGGGLEIADALEAEVATNHLDMCIERFNCLGFCDSGPNLKILPDGRFVHALQLADIPAFISNIFDLPGAE
jgi:(2Fe-2S) ferredoxin